MSASIVASRKRLSVLSLLIVLCPATPALGQQSSPSCPPGNLLAIARVSDSLDVQGSTRLAVNDTVLANGAAFHAQQGIRFQSAAGSLTYDLGAPMPIIAAFVQADASNSFSLQVSDDGKEFREIWKVPKTAARGTHMRSRWETFFGVNARFVRFGEPTGFGSGSLSELQVFCQIPANWPPQTAVFVAAQEGSGAPRPWYRLTPRNADVIKTVLAFFGAGLLGWGWFLNQRGVPGRYKRFRDGLLIVLGILGYTGYYNWGAYHFPDRIHNHEFFHYFVGAKYFPELGYTGLYECANLAEAEQGFRRRVELRIIRDLRRNERAPAKYILDNPEQCKRGFTRPFTPRRWEEFKQDVAYFRNHSDIARWEKMLTDHGYNPSPVWNMSGSILANLAPASDAFIGLLGWIDPLLLLIAFGFIAWAFGWRVACVSLLYFGTNEPAPYFWTGGAFLRQDWFLWAMVGICLLKRGKPMLGGAGLAVSTLLRVFPAAFFVAIGLRLLWILFRERRIDRTGGRIVAGAALAVAILLPASSMVAGGFSAWPGFIRNTAKHADTPLTNNMGLHTLVAFRWETRQKVMYDPRQMDPFHDFREARKQAFRGIFGLPLFLVLVGAYLALLSYGVRREMEWWVLAAFGFAVMPVSMELACYYFLFLTAAAFLWEKQELIPVGLLLLSGFGRVIEFQTYFYDIRYALESAAVIAFVVWATWVYARRRVQAPGLIAAPETR